MVTRCDSSEAARRTRSVDTILPMPVQATVDAADPPNMRISQRDYIAGLILYLILIQNYVMIVQVSRDEIPR